jgi:hypothetical protein
VRAGGTQPSQPASRELRNLAIEPSAFAAELAVVMEQVMKEQHGPRSGGRISGERVPAPDCRCQHGLFSDSKCKCLYWQRDWGDVPKALTEDTELPKKASKK